MNRNAWTVIGVAVVILGALFLYTRSIPTTENQTGSNATSTIATTTPSNDVVATTTVRSYGQVKLGLNEYALYPGGNIRILSVNEDSRCAVGVQCIWAGTVKITLEYTLNGTPKRDSLELNKSITRGQEKITLVAVEPSNLQGKTIRDADYRFTVSVSKTTSPTPTSNPGTPVTSAGCFVGGCSGQICSDSPGAISDCMYREEYACYKTAKCERQSNGQCGWAQTTELKMCLANAR